MKVLVVTGAFPPANFAEANHAFHLCQHLARHGLDVHVLTNRGAETDGFPFSVHPIMRDWSWADAPRFSAFVRRCAPDAVLMIYIGFIYGDHPMATFAASLAKRAAPRAPFAVQFENAMGAPAGRCSLGARVVRWGVKRWLGPAGVDYEFGTLLRDSDRVIVLCARHEAKLAALEPAMREKSVLIPAPPMVKVLPEAGGASRRSGRALLGVGPDEFVLTYFGYIYPNKGIETLLRALHLVKSRGGSGRVVIAGGVPAHQQEERARYLAELKDLAVSLRIEKDVSWTGHCSWDGDEASLYMHAADACVLPFDDGVSLNNGTVAAAAAHGLPIITTRGPVLEDAFVDGVNVLLFPPREPAQLATAIEAVATDLGLRRRLAAGAAALSEEWFSWDGVVARTRAALEAPAGRDR